MTSVRAAGYSSAGRTMEKIPFSVDQESWEQQADKIEAKLMTMIRESVMKSKNGDHVGSLEVAKLAQKELSDSQKLHPVWGIRTIDIMFSVHFNLAVQFEASQLHSKALGCYKYILEHKLSHQPAQMRFCMGHIYLQQKRHTTAIKMYRIAFDQTPISSKSQRMKIMAQIGEAFMLDNNYNDAISCFENVMETKYDYKAAFNILLCYSKLGDKMKMKHGFEVLVSELVHDDVQRRAEMAPDLSKFMAKVDHLILVASNLVCDKIEETSLKGYDWILSTIQSSPFSRLWPDIEIARILVMKRNDLTGAMNSLNTCIEEHEIMSKTAAITVSGLLFSQGNYEASEKWADAALALDKYDSQAKTNKGNVYFSQGTNG